MSTNKRRHPRAVFTDDEVREIRADREKVPTPSINELAAKYHVNKLTLWKMLNGRTYKDVK